MGEQHIQWIYLDPALHHPKMQAETCAVAGIAYITYNLPCRCVQQFAAEAAYEYHIPTRHASLTARFVACLFLHTQICGKNIALRGIFLIDKLPPPRSKIDINMYKVHKFLSTT